MRHDIYFGIGIFLLATTATLDGLGCRYSIFGHCGWNGIYLAKRCRWSRVVWACLFGGSTTLAIRSSRRCGFGISYLVDLSIAIGSFLRTQEFVSVFHQQEILFISSISAGGVAGNNYFLVYALR